MIRINLLEKSKGKNKRGAAVRPCGRMEMGDIGSPKLKVLLVLVLAGSLNLCYWYRLDTGEKQIAAQMEVAEQRNRELADVKARYLERQRQADNYKRRVDVIDQLRASQSGPVNLLTMHRGHDQRHRSGVAQHHEGSGRQRGYRRHGAERRCRGLADSESAKDGIFKNIEIKETYQDETFKEMQAFQFILTCEKAKS